MAIFKAKIHDKKGMRTVEISARSMEEAKAHAGRIGDVVSINKEFKLDFSPPMSASERQIFFTRLSSMLASRVGTGEALQLMRDTFRGKIQEVSARLLSYLETGDDLASAFAKVGSPDIPDATIAMITAGSKSGETWRAVKEAAAFEYELYNIKKSAGKGIASAFAGFLFAGVTTVASTVWLGPKIMESDLMKMAASNGSITTGWVTTVGNVMGYVMGVLMILSFMLIFLAQVGRRVMPLQADKIILKIPFYKDLVLSRNNFIVFYGLALLIKSGVRTEEALRLSAEAAPKGALRKDLQEATKAVKTGRPWAKAMETLHPTDRAALLCATDREQVVFTLDTLSRQYRELYAQRLASFVPVLNLLAALFLSLAGAIMFGESILPMLQASTGLT